MAYLRHPRFRYSSAVLRLAALPVFAIAGLITILFLGNGVEAGQQRTNFLPGQIICTTDTAAENCYMIYRPTHADSVKKYIGHPEVRFTYNPLVNNPVRAEARAKQSQMDAYPTFNWNLGMPCGSLVGDLRDGKIYVMEPIDSTGDPMRAQFGLGVYSNVFPHYVPSLSTPTLQQIVQPDRIRWVSAVDNVLGVTTDGRSLPPCTIVHRAGTPDYYMTTGHMELDGLKEPGRIYIGTPEILDFWIERIGFYVEVTSGLNLYPIGWGGIGPPPGMLFRTIEDPTVYFSGDDGYLWRINSKEDAQLLGFVTADGFWNADVHYVSQSLIDSAQHREAAP